MKVVWPACDSGKRTLFALSLFICLATVQQTRAQDQLPELVRRIKPSAVAIETFDARGEKLSRGSGFFIDTDRIVTNRHVIDGAYRAEVHSVSGANYPVRRCSVESPRPVPPIP